MLAVFYIVVAKYSIVGGKYHFVSEWLVIVCCKVWCVYEVNHRAELGPSDNDLLHNKLDYD